MLNSLRASALPVQTLEMQYKLAKNYTKARGRF